MIKAILFDLDETIILDEPISQKAFLAAAELATVKFTVDAGALALTAHTIARRLWQESAFFDYCNRIGHSAVEGLWARYDRGEQPDFSKLRAWATRFRLTVWREALRAHGISDREPSLPERMANRFFAVRREYPRYPEIDGILEALGPRFALGIVTNGVPDLQREKLMGSGVAHLFQASVVSGEVDSGKPDPGIFNRICRDLSVLPEECVMVGDNPERDVAGARAAGMRSVWVQRHGSARDPRFPADLECTDLSAMLPWLEGLQ